MPSSETRRVRVAIESPYKAPTSDGVARNIAFAQALLRDVIQRGASPFAMHLLYTQVLDDTNPLERTDGIECGLAWTDVADEVWYCLRPDEPMTSGMELAVARNTALVAAGDPRRIRHLRFTQEGVCLTPEVLDDFLSHVAVADTPPAMPLTRPARVRA
jgi:hypothetical protein